MTNLKNVNTSVHLSALEPRCDDLLPRLLGGWRSLGEKEPLTRGARERGLLQALGKGELNEP